MSYDTLLTETRGAVEILTLNRPDALNALNPQMVGELNDYFDSLHRRKNSRVIILRGAGRAFCAGLDLHTWDGTDSSATVQRVLETQQRIARIYQLMRSCPQPIISLVHGAACGGGFSLALASDIRLAGPKGRMNAAYIKIGLTACDMGCSYFLPRLIGLSIASELMMTGRFIDADRALRVGLVSDVLPEEELLSAGLALADEMLATAPQGLRMTKEALNHNIDAQSLTAAMAMEDRHQALLSFTADHKEAIAAFLQKRPPLWVDG
jgi:enoyl-CoA hydratase/carnithine racemase